MEIDLMLLLLSMKSVLFHGQCYTCNDIAKSNKESAFFLSRLERNVCTLRMVIMYFKIYFVRTGFVVLVTVFFHRIV